MPVWFVLSPRRKRRGDSSYCTTGWKPLLHLCLPCEFLWRTGILPVIFFHLLPAAFAGGEKVIIFNRLEACPPSVSPMRVFMEDGHLPVIFFHLLPAAWLGGEGDYFQQAVKPVLLFSQQAGNLSSICASHASFWNKTCSNDTIYRTTAVKSCLFHVSLENSRKTPLLFIKNSL